MYSRLLSNTPWLLWTGLGGAVTEVTFHHVYEAAAAQLHLKETETFFKKRSLSLVQMKAKRK